MVSKRKSGLGIVFGSRAALARVVILSLAVLLAASGPALAGQVVKAQCPCGYHADNLFLFGGRANFETYCGFPVHCEDCPSLAMVNLYENKMTCPQCPESVAVPYDDPSLIGQAGDKVVAQWNTSKQLGRDLKLTNGLYRCPACGKFTLRFSAVGMWD